MTTTNRNKAIPVVKVILGNKERALKFDLNAMVTFEEATGKSLMKGEIKSEDMGPRDIRVLLWACLMHEDEALTEKQVGSWITVNNMMEVVERLNEAFEVAMPEGGDKQNLPLVRKHQRG